MSTTINTDGTLTIAAMSLVEMLPEVERAILNGYRLDVESNIGWPQMIGTLFTVVMFPEGDVEVSEATLEVVEEEDVLKEPLMDEVILHLELIKDDTPLAVIQESQEAIAEVLEAPVIKVDGRKKRV